MCGWMWDGCVSVACLQQALSWSSWWIGDLLGRLEELWSGQGRWVDRGVVLVLYECVCTCEPEECCVCACTSHLQSPPTEEGTWPSVLVFYGSAAEGSILSDSLCDQLWQWLCACLCVRPWPPQVFVFETSAQLCYQLNLSPAVCRCLIGKEQKKWI